MWVRFGVAAPPVEAAASPALGVAAAAAAKPAAKRRDKVGLDKFDLVKVIGKGSFGTVLLVNKKDTGTACMRVCISVCGI